MKIGLIDVDCHASKRRWSSTIYPNIAIAKIARYHIEHGDEVEWAIPFNHYDILYKSRIFNFSADDLTIYDADKVVKGGTGYDIESKLPEEIEYLQPYYDIYPHIPVDTAYGFLTRGCPNKCKWCVVPRKEGMIRPYMDVNDIAIDGRNKLVLMDNNILAAGEYAVEQLEKAIHYGYALDFNQAMDARLVDDRFARLLSKVKWIRQICFGCDTKAQIDECERAVSMIESFGYNGEFVMYTMLTDNFDESYNRVLHWWNRLKQRRSQHRGGCYAYAQPFRDPDNPTRPIPQWQKDMTQWVNKKMLYCTIPFGEFVPRKGFKCEEYLRM